MAPPFPEQISTPSGSRPSVDYVAMALREAITRGELQPNERLVEEELARALGTNRALVRSALARLEHERLIVREPNRGARVRTFTRDEAAEILETRSVLEGLIARRAAQRIDAAGIAALQTILAEMHARQSHGDLLGYSQLNARFHRTILERAQHETVARLLALLQSQSVRYQFRTVLEPGRAAHSLAEHEAIFAALQAHDPDAAERAARLHVENVIATVRTVAANRLLG
jgi:DNA-binding GntR family transcriptional regulator